MTERIEIDGSHGEGGGQIVRSSLALSLLTGRPVTIERIRAGREKPGLQRQHLAAVDAAVAVSGGEARGAALGASSITFHPGSVCGGEYTFRVGTAGSTTLVLQTVLPALLLAPTPSRLILEGGTHNPWAPPYDFLARAYLPLINQLGPHVTLQLSEYGFYPAGGGRITIDIQPASRLLGLELLTRGEFRHRRVVVLLARLPAHIAEREASAIIEPLGWSPEDVEVCRVSSRGPGNVVFAEWSSGAVCEVFTGFGRIGTRAEEVGREVVAQVESYLATDVPVGPYLADQLLLPLGVAAWQGHPSVFRTTSLSLHSTTHRDIVQRFLDIEMELIEESDSGTTRVQLR